MMVSWKILLQGSIGDYQISQKVFVCNIDIVLFTAAAPYVSDLSSDDDCLRMVNSNSISNTECF